MDPSPLRDALTVGLGLATGVMSGAFGVGGAVFATPGIRVLGADAKIAVGTTLPPILPGAISGGLRYTREGLVEWRAVATTAPVGVLAAAIGAELVEVLPGGGHPIQIITAGLLLFSGYRLIRGSRAAMVEQAAPVSPSIATLVAIGLLAGFLSGLLGIGGGVVMVPAFVALAGLPIKRATGTSLICVAIFAIPGMIVHALNGNIDWRFSFWLTVGVVPGARIGSALALKATDRRLQVSFGWFLTILAIPYLVVETAALLG